MEPTDLTTRVLIEIRNEARRTNERVDHLETRFDHLDTRFDHLEERLDRRIIESEVRTATAINELGGTLREVHTLLKDRALNDRVARCELEIAELKQRLG